MSSNGDRVPLRRQSVLDHVTGSCDVGSRTVVRTREGVDKMG